MPDNLSTLTLQQLDDTYQEVTRKFDEAVLIMKAGQQTRREGARLLVKLNVLTGQLDCVLNEYSRRGGQITPCLIEGPRQPSNTWKREVAVHTEDRLADDRTEDLWPARVQHRG